MRHVMHLLHESGGAGAPTCTAGAFLILSLSTKVPTGLGDNCPFTFPLPTLPPPH